MNQRQKWLYTFIATNVATFLYLLFGFAVLNMASGLSIGIFLVMTLITVSITMHCSYISSGSKWLLFQVISGPLGLLVSIIWILYARITGVFPVGYEHYNTIVFSPLHLYFAWQCYLLRKQYLAERLVAEIAEV